MKSLIKWFLPLLVSAYVEQGSLAAYGAVSDYWPADSWPQWRRDPAKNAFNPVSTLPATLPETFWRFPTPANAANSSPAVVNGKVFFGSSDGTVYCLKQITANANGERIWSYTTGGRIWSAPAVAYNRVFVTSRDGYLYCFKETPTNLPSGEVLWKKFIGPISIMNPSPCVVNGRVFVGSETGYLSCFDALSTNSNGTLLWQYYCGGWIHSSPAFAEGRVYIGTSGPLPTNGYRLYCLKAETTNALGESFWSFRIGDKANGMLITPTVADGKVYFSADDGWLRCLDATNGAVLWQRFIQQMDGPSPAVAFGRVYKTYEARKGLDCWEAVPATDPGTDGELIWSYPDSGVDRTGATVADGKVLHTSWDDKLYCFDALTNRTNILWTFSPIDMPGSQGIGSAPSIANGLIFVGDGNGLRALRPRGGNLPPSVSAAAAPGSGQRVNFSASASDLDGSIASYQWRFGDGETSTNPNPTHAYAAAGNYIASVRATDNQGAQNETTVFVSVKLNPAWRMNIRQETNAVRLGWAGGVEARQFLERCSDLGDSNDVWETIWTNNQPVPPPASFVDQVGANRQNFYRLRVE
ncbi:MAG: PQQ-binding-like beta-propeller repeat protein [Verrucomicrobiota bacterium]